MKKTKPGKGQLKAWPKELPLNNTINNRLETQRGRLLRARSICNLASRGIANASAFERSLPDFIDNFESAIDLVSEMLLLVIDELDTVNLLKPEATEGQS